MEINLEKEILLRGCFGLSNWLRKNQFEKALCLETDIMGEVCVLVDRCYRMLTEKYFMKGESEVVYMELPKVSMWLEKKYPSPFTAKEWIFFTQEMIYDMLSLARRKSYPDEYPLWCDMLAGFVLMLLGRKCAEDNRFQNIQLLTRLVESEDLSWEFYRGFTLSKDLLAEAEHSLDIKPNVILGDSVMLSIPQTEYDLKEKKDSEILADLYYYEQSGGYVEFPGFLVMVARGFKDNRWNDSLITLWEKLAHPVLQYGLLYHIEVLPDDCIELLEIMKKRGIGEVGLTLMRDFWFNETISAMEKLLQFEDCTDTEALADEIMPIVEKVKSEFDGKVETASRQLLDFFSAEDLSRWAYSMSTLGDKPDSIYKKAYLKVLITLKDVLDTVGNVDAFSVDTKDLSYLFFLAQKALDANDRRRCEQIERVVLNLIDDGSFGWFGSMNQGVLDQMSVLSSLLLFNHSNNTRKDILDLVRARIVKYEGWDKTPIERVSNQTYIFSFLMGAALLVDWEECDFMDLVGLAIDQANNVGMSNDALLVPLYVAELVVTHCRKEWRERYEQTLLIELEKFEWVLRILVQAETAMTEATKALFLQRKQEEWELIERQYYTTKRQFEWRKIEKMMREVETKA